MHVTANGNAAAYENGLANGHAVDEGGDDAVSNCSEKPVEGTWSPLAGAWQAVRQQLLGGIAPPAVPEIYRQGSHAVPASHSVYPHSSRH